MRAVCDHVEEAGIGPERDTMLERTLVAAGLAKRAMAAPAPELELSHQKRGPSPRPNRQPGLGAAPELRAPIP